MPTYLSSWRQSDVGWQRTANGIERLAMKDEGWLVRWNKEDEGLATRARRDGDGRRGEEERRKAPVRGAGPVEGNEWTARKRRIGDWIGQRWEAWSSGQCADTHPTTTAQALISGNDSVGGAPPITATCATEY